MTLCRDWQSTLWAASFKAFPFYVEKDDESGGRRIVVHEFPMRDDPFLEDLGEAPRYFEVSAYIVGGAADLQAMAFSTMLAAPGSGLLVLPSHGPRQARCVNFSRDNSKDRQGYIGFKIRFCREGAVFALTSVAALANSVSIAVSALASVAGAAFAQIVMVRGVPDYVSQAASDTLASVGVALDDVRAGAQLDAEHNSKAFADATSLVADASSLIEQAPDRVFDLARDISEGMEAGRAVDAFSALVRSWSASVPRPGATQAERLAASNAGEVTRLVRLAGFGAMAEALTRQTFPSRQDGVSARANFVEQVDTELEQMIGAAFSSLFVELQRVRNATVEYLSRIVADLAPVITVDVPLSMPSLFLAWRLYQDPLRAGELVARNKVPHPSYMPPQFEALAR